MQNDPEAVRCSMVTLGTAEYTYEVFDNWAQLPHSWSFKE